jgi:hypothetical protein
MQQDIKELRELPLEDLITAPINAVITAQRNAAITTMKFIEEIGLIRPDEDSFFDTPTDASKNDYEVRIAKLKVKHTLAPVPPSTTPTVNETVVELPFISLFNIPSFEIGTMEWEFNAKLKSMVGFTAKAKLSSATTTTGGGGASIGGGLIPIKIGASMKIESTVKTDFESRFKTGREQEYNLRIKINANSAPTPKGIEKLLDIAQSLVQK